MIERVEGRSKTSVVFVLWRSTASSAWIYSLLEANLVSLGLLLSSNTENSGNFQGTGLGVMILCFLETGASRPGVSSTVHLLSEVFFHGTALAVPTD